MYTADQICRMLEFLVDKIFVQFEGCIFIRLLKWEQIVLPH